MNQQQPSELGRLAAVIAAAWATATVVPYLVFAVGAVALFGFLVLA